MISISRTWRIRFFVLLFFFNLVVSVTGIFALSSTPVLFFDSGYSFSAAGYEISRIGDIELTEAFFYRLPEFYFPGEELNWWRMHESVYEVLAEEKLITVELDRNNSYAGEVAAMPGSMGLMEAMKNTGLIYLAGFIYMISAASVFRKHHSTAGSILAFFLLSGSLYLISSAPVVNREITLVPAYFRLITDANYIASGGLITLVHFAFVFPRPKEIFIHRTSVPLIILYGYFLLTIVLYFSGIIAFASSTPFLFFWTLIMIAAFIHSIVKEKDRFLRKQISLSLLAPLMVAFIFILFHVLPGILGTTSMRFTYFALFSLILPFALPSAMDNSRLYQEKLEMERKSQREKERIRQDLHDNVLNGLAAISLFSEVSSNILDRDRSGVRQRLESIKDIARDSSRQLRGFLWITDDEHNTWEDFCSYLRRYGYAVLKNLDINFELEISRKLKILKLPSLQFRGCVYQVFRETINNIIKHSHADKVSASLSSIGDTFIFTIKDNGRGFNPEEAKQGHYGIGNMKKRVEETGGSLIIESRKSRGTRIVIEIPLS